MKITDTEHIKISYETTNRRLTQTWVGFLSSEEFREGIDKTVEFVRKNKVDTILSDTINQHVVKPEDANYAGEAMPYLIKSGLKAMAFVVPESVFTQMSLKRFSNASGQDFAKYFRTTKEAEQWLEKIH